MTPTQRTHGVAESAKQLLEQHQAIIDAWFDNWIKRERARIDEAFRRHSEGSKHD